MPIDFSMEHWEQVKETHRLWWRGELDRPLLYATVFTGGCVVWHGGGMDDLPKVTEFLARYGVSPM